MKLLICDDDISAIDAMQDRLNCQELGIQCILRAYDGQAALKIIEQEHPELVLCDIEMPKVSGIDVLHYIYDNSIYTEFAFLTCHRDFEYAREAVRYGAADYLTKPVDFDELNGALRRMVHSAKVHFAAAGKQEDQNALDTKRNNVIRQIYDGFYGTNRERIEYVLRRNDLNYFSADTPIRLVMTEAAAEDDFTDGWERDLLAYSYGRLAEEVLTGYIGYSSTVVNIGSRYIGTTTFIQAGRSSKDETFAKVRELLRVCSMHLTLIPVCMISDDFPLYQAAAVVSEMRAQFMKVLMQSGSIYTLRDVKKLTGIHTPFINEVQVLRLLKKQDKAAYTEMITRAVDRISHTHSDNDSMMYELRQDVFQAFHTFLRDNGLPIRVLFQNEELHLLERIANRSALDMVNYASFLFDYVSEVLQRKSEGTDIITTAKRFIRTHYKEDIDRDAVAAAAYITPNYLSKRFRAEMGMSLREYINQLRIDEAKRLLLSTDATVSEVAREVGYDNISYFSTVFRKLCGMSPVEWCEDKRSEAENYEVE